MSVLCYIICMKVCVPSDIIDMIGWGVELYIIYIYVDMSSFMVGGTWSIYGLQKYGKYEIRLNVLATNCFAQ